MSPAEVVFFIPPGLKGVKAHLFATIAHKIERAGGKAVRDDHAAIECLPPELVPIIGCSPQLTPMIKAWLASGRRFVYWDRGYMRRLYASWLPLGMSGFYRWHVSAFQMRRIVERPADRYAKLETPLAPWAKGGKHIVVAAPSRTYARFHLCESWIADTMLKLSRVTDRQIVIRDKESPRPLQDDLRGAHACVSHGSIAAVESVILGCPVFVDGSSAAALVGLTDLQEIERPIYPDREAWVRALAYSQFNEAELLDGTLWQWLE